MKYISYSSKLTKWVITLFFLSFLVIILWSYKQQLLTSAQANDQSAEFTVNVVAIKAEEFTHQEKVKVSGEVKAAQQLRVSNEIPGKVVGIYFRAGERVKKGQLLVELEHQQEDAQLLAQQAKLKLSQKSYARLKRLLVGGKVSKDEVDRAEADFMIADARVKELQALISKKQLYAPYDAETSLHDIKLGQFLEADTEITQLVGLDSDYWVDFSLPQFLENIAIGTSVTLLGLSKNTDPMLASIIALEPLVTEKGRKVKYRAQVRSKGKSLRANAFVNVHVPVKEEVKGVFVPNLSITRDPMGEYIHLLVVDENGEYRAQRQAITVNERLGGGVLVSEDLSAGTVIAGKGAFKLFDGVKVSMSNLLAVTSKVATHE